MSVRLHDAVALPVALPPVAAWPFTITLDTPLPPRPLSLAVPEIVTDAALSVCPFVWLVIDSAGAVVSAAAAVIVQTNERDTVTSESFTKTVTL